MDSPQAKYTIWTWKVETHHDRADTALLEAITNQRGFSQQPIDPISRTRLKKLFDEKRVTQNHSVLKPSSKLTPHSVIEIQFPTPVLLELNPENRSLDILFEDEHLLIINKPPMLTVHPCSTQMKETLVHSLLYHIKNLSGIGGVLRPGIVHRIDKNTSGTLVITKTDRAHIQLSTDFSKHSIQRSYWALCYSAPVPSENKIIKIESLLGRNPNDRKKMSIQVKNGKKAISYVKTLDQYCIRPKKPFASKLEITLETGRTHQVRVHLTNLGCSILGDPIYGTPTRTQAKWTALPTSIQKLVHALPGQALHARTLGFTHPITGIQMKFEALPPPAFQTLLQELQLHQA